MKYLAFLSLVFSSTALGFVVLPAEHQQRVFGVNEVGADAHTQQHAPSPEEELRLIQTSPVETRWVSEEDKLELKRVCFHGSTSPPCRCGS